MKDELPPLPEPSGYLREARDEPGELSEAYYDINRSHPSQFVPQKRLHNVRALFSVDQMQAYARSAVMAERERLVAFAKAKGWGMRDDGPFDEAISECWQEMDRAAAAIRGQTKE